MGQDPSRLFLVGDRAARECLDVLQVHRGPYGCPGVVQLLAGPDDLRLPEAGKEHRQITLDNPVAATEVVQGLEEVLPVVEGDAEGPPKGELVAVHRAPISPRLPGSPGGRSGPGRRR